MSGKEDPKVNGMPSKSFNEIGKVLAAGLKGHPFFLFLAITLFFCTVGTLFSGSDFAIYGLFFLALLFGLLAYLFNKQVIEQQKDIEFSTKQADSESFKSYSSLNSTPSSVKKDIITLLKSIHEDASESLNLPSKELRINIFGENEGTMKMIPGLAINMTRKKELSISMPVGYGSTGRAFESCTPNIAIFNEGWGDSSITDAELQKAHSKLRWILSIPILLMSEKPKAVGVLNIDGINTPKTEEEIKNMVKPLLFYCQALSMIIGKSLKSEEQQ